MSSSLNPMHMGDVVYSVVKFVPTATLHQLTSVCKMYSIIVDDELKNENRKMKYFIKKVQEVYKMHDVVRLNFSGINMLK